MGARESKLAAETDQDGAPIIKGVAGKISTLQRRFDYLQEQLEFTTGPQTGFMRSELAALRYGIRALRYHRAMLEDLDTPIEVLADLVSALEYAGMPMSQAVVRAKQVLKEWT